MRPYYRFMRFLSQGAFAMYFHGRVFDIRNVPLSGGVLLACNHQSFFDPLAATCALPREGNYLARDTLFRVRPFARLITSVNAFPIRRGTGDTAAVKEILRRMKAGRVMTIFVEGTRTRDGNIGKINANSLILAKRAKVVIVPTAIDGAFQAWPRKRVLPSPGTIYVTYAKAISVEEVQAWPIDRIVDVVNRRLREALARSKRRRRHAAANAWLNRSAEPGRISPSA